MEKKIHIIDDPNKMAAFVFSHAGNDDEAVLLALDDYSGAPEPVNPIFRATLSAWQSHSE